VASPHFSNPGDHIIFWFERPQGIAPTVFNTIDGLPHNYALRIMNCEFISHLKCEKTFVFSTVSFFVGKIERLTNLP